MAKRSDEAVLRPEAAPAPGRSSPDPVLRTHSFSSREMGLNRGPQIRVSGGLCHWRKRLGQPMLGVVDIGQFLQKQGFKLLHGRRGIKWGCFSLLTGSYPGPARTRRPGRNLFSGDRAGVDVRRRVLVTCGLRPGASVPPKTESALRTLARAEVADYTPAAVQGPPPGARGHADVGAGELKRESQPTNYAGEDKGKGHGSAVLPDRMRSRPRAGVKPGSRELQLDQRQVVFERG
jgi:hypothetical protein